MNSLFRRTALGLIVGVVGFALAATGVGGGGSQPAKKEEKKDAEKKQIVVGFSQCGAENDWRTAETKSIKEEAEARGVTLKFSDASGKPAEQIKAIQEFVRQKVDVIVLAPKIETGWDDALERAKKAGIPVILVDRGIKTKDETLYKTLIASDFVEEGKMAGEWLAKKLAGKGNIVELQGTTGSAPANDRRMGFAEAIEKHSDLKIIKSQTANFERTKGKEVMEAILKAERGKVNAVYAHNDAMALGAIEAIKDAGLKPGTDVIVISIDGIKGAFEAMVEGTLNATVECTPLLGPAVFDAIEKIQAGTEVAKFIKSEDKLYEQSEAAKVIDKRKY